MWNGVLYKQSKLEAYYKAYIPNLYNVLTHTTYSFYVNSKQGGGNRQIKLR